MAVAARVPRPAALAAGAVSGLVGLAVPPVAAGAAVPAVAGAPPLAATQVVPAALAALGELLPVLAAPRVVSQPARQAAPPN